MLSLSDLIGWFVGLSGHQVRVARRRPDADRWPNGAAFSIVLHSFVHAFGNAGLYAGSDRLRVGITMFPLQSPALRDPGGPGSGRMLRS